MYTPFVVACLVGGVWGQVGSVCVDDTSAVFPVLGNYSHYDDSDGFSIYIQQTLGEAYIFYFEENLGNTYEAWGLYSCQSAFTYEDQADDATDKSPATKENCNSDPVMFCPALDDDDANSLYDGASPSDGELNYDASAFPHFYNCSNWFAYESDANYPTGKTLTWKLNDICYSDSDNSNNNNNGGSVGPGERTDNASDSESANSMSSGAKAVLWIILSLFIVACVAAACYFGYHWYQKHQTELRQSMTKNQGDIEAGPAALGPVKSSSVNDDGNTLETGTDTTLQ